MGRSLQGNSCEAAAGDNAPSDRAHTNPEVGIAGPTIPSRESDSCGAKCVDERAISF